MSVPASSTLAERPSRRSSCSMRRPPNPAPITMASKSGAAPFAASDRDVFMSDMSNLPWTPPMGRDHNRRCSSRAHSTDSFQQSLSLPDNSLHNAKQLRLCPSTDEFGVLVEDRQHLLARFRRQSEDHALHAELCVTIDGSPIRR